MKFMPNTIRSIIILAMISLTNGEGDGSTTCHSTPTIPGSFHGNNPAGTLADGGFVVLVNGQTMSLTDVNILSAGTHSIIVRQSGGTFIGLYMWGSTDIALSVSTDDSVKGGKSWRAGSSNISCGTGSSALTHTGIESKTQSGGILTMPSSGTIEVQVQPMTSFTSGSTFYWSSLTFKAEGEVSTPAPVTTNPTMAPVAGPAPVASPTRAPVVDGTSEPTYDDDEDDDDYSAPSSDSGSESSDSLSDSTSGSRKLTNLRGSALL